MLDTGVLQVTGRGRNVNFAIDDSLPLEAVVQELRRSLAKNKLLYSRGSVTVEVGRRMLAREELTEIKRVLESESGLTISQFWCSPAILEGAPPEKAGPGLGVAQPAPTTAAEPAPDFLPDPLDEATPSLAESQPEGEGFSGDSLTAEGSPLPWPEPDLPVRPEVSSMVSSVAPLPVQERREVEEDSQSDITSAESGESGESEDPAAGAESTLVDPLPAPADDGLTQASSTLLGSPPAPDYDELTEASSTLLGSFPAPADDGLIDTPPALLVSPQALADDGLTEAPQAPEDTPQPPINAIPAQPALQEPEPTISPARTIIDLEQEVVGLYRGNEALLIKTTCRSGEVIRYPGDIVVLADVNPGAEIIAEGDILVFGTLRGLAHAGAGGDIQATIIAVKLQAPRLQIGPYTGMEPKSRQKPRSPQTGPMIAYVRRQHIFVAPFAGRFARYSGGTVYDG